MLPRLSSCLVGRGITRGGMRRTYVSSLVQRRRLSGGGHGHGGNSSNEYDGFRVPHVATWHKVAGEVMMTTMFLWIFYRAKEDLLVVLGVQHPWDAHHHHHGGDHDDHHDGHHAETAQWVKEGPGATPKLHSGDGDDAHHGEEEEHGGH